MAENKNHHFVPQFYLRRFGQGRRVALYNLEDKRHVQGASIKGQCQRDYLYGRDPSLEKAFSSMEGQAAAVINKMVTDREAPPSPSKEEIDLIIFLAFQHGRTPAAATELNAQLQRMVRAIALAPTAPPEIREYADEVMASYADPVAFALNTVAKVAPMLTDLHKCVLVNETTTEFITSDAPVVLHNAWCEKVTWQGTTGFASAGLQVLLPLDPAHALLMFDRDVYAVGCKQAPKHVALRDPEDVHAINSMQMTVAEQNLYYSGNPATKSAIDALPVEWWAPPGDKAVVDRALDDSNTSQLMVAYRRTRGQLSLSFLRLLKKAAGVRLQDRAGKHRLAAMQLDELLNGPRHARYDDPPPGTASRSWSVVREP